MSQKKVRVIEILLKQFVVEALKKIKDDSLEMKVKEALNCIDTSVFLQLLECPNIIPLKPVSLLRTPYTFVLRLSSQGTYLDYLENKEYFPELSERQIKRLQYCTIVTLANKMKTIPYNVLLKELDIDNVKDLEKFIIGAINLNVISGELNQKDNCLEINSTVSKDVRTNYVDNAIDTLQQFCEMAVKMFFPKYKVVLLMLIKINKEHRNVHNAVLQLKMN